nr:hypothetical protein [Tanacetum cinerariifolium]
MQISDIPRCVLDGNKCTEKVPTRCSDSRIVVHWIDQVAISPHFCPQRTRCSIQKAMHNVTWIRVGYVDLITTSSGILLLWVMLATSQRVTSLPQLMDRTLSLMKPQSEAPTVPKSPLQMDNINVPVVSFLGHCILQADATAHESWPAMHKSWATRSS